MLCISKSAGPIIRYGIHPKINWADYPLDKQVPLSDVSSNYTPRYASRPRTIGKASHRPIGCTIHQDLIEPTIIPLMKCFCRNGYTSIMGRVAITITAILSPSGEMD